MAVVGRLDRAGVVVCAAALVAACGVPQPSPAPPTTSGSSTARLTVSLVLVPVCGPSSPAPTGCAPQPLPGVRVTVADVDGRTVGVGVGDGVGRVAFTLAPGHYVVTGATVPSAVPPRPADVTVAMGRSATVTIRYESNLQ